jgi:hypothetical protein
MSVQKTLVHILKLVSNQLVSLASRENKSQSSTWDYGFTSVVSNQLVSLASREKVVIFQSQGFKNRFQSISFPSE